MSNIGAKVAVVGCGISGAVCASILAKNGVSVTVFESARGAGGRMSHRRESTEDGKVLLFDHGAPYFTATNPDVLCLIHDWGKKALVAEWNQKFESFDCISKQFLYAGKDELSKKFVGIPGMNSICKSLCQEPGVESKFGTGVGRLQWLENEDLWSLAGFDGKNLGHFKGVVVSDKNIVSPRFSNLTGRPQPLDVSVIPELSRKMEEIPVKSCFALMLAFEEPLSSIPVRGFSFKNSKVLNSAFCENSKPGRSAESERWVLHSTSEYAQDIIAQTGLKKPSTEILTKVADELFQEFQSTGITVSQPFFKKAHRWGSAFPATSIAREEKCLWDGKKRVAICGDFCVSPNVEGAIISGMAAASKFVDVVSYW